MLRLVETIAMPIVAEAATEAIRPSAVGFDAVKLSAHPARPRQMPWGHRIWRRLSRPQGAAGLILLANFQARALARELPIGTASDFPALCQGSLRAEGQSRWAVLAQWKSTGGRLCSGSARAPPL
jgi:hypothetical protein